MKKYLMAISLCACMMQASDEELVIYEKPEWIANDHDSWIDYEGVQWGINDVINQEDDVNNIMHGLIHLFADNQVYAKRNNQKNTSDEKRKNIRLKSFAECYWVLGSTTFAGLLPLYITQCQENEHALFWRVINNKKTHQAVTYHLLLHFLSKNGKFENTINPKICSNDADEAYNFLVENSTTFDVEINHFALQIKCSSQFLDGNEWMDKSMEEKLDCLSKYVDDECSYKKDWSNGQKLMIAGILFTILFGGYQGYQYWNNQSSEV